MQDIFRQLQLTGIVPVIKITDAAKAVPLAKALAVGGLNCAEITFRTAQAADAIKAVTQALPDMPVGAGTVLTCAQADEAVAAGAKFIVAPGFNPDVVRHCQDINIPVLPGCCTPSEIEQALSLGLTVVKFFPAEAAGGLDMVKAMAAPYGNVRFVPTGGIGPANLLSYLSFKKILACGGSWMVKEELIDAGAFERIAEMTRTAVDLMLGFEVVSVDTGSAEDFARLFGENALSHASAQADRRRVVIKTRFLERAAYYLKQRGAAIQETDESGAMDTRKEFTLRDPVGGYTVCVVQG